MSSIEEIRNPALILLQKIWEKTMRTSARLSFFTLSAEARALTWADSDNNKREFVIVKNSNGEFLRSEELTQKITFSATYIIFANHKIAGISFFTFFRVFSTIFDELHSKIFSPQKNL